MIYVLIEIIFVHGPIYSTCSCTGELHKTSEILVRTSRHDGEKVFTDWSPLTFPQEFKLTYLIPPSAFSSLFFRLPLFTSLSPVLHSTLQSSALQLPLWSHWFVKISEAAVEIGLQS